MRIYKRNESYYKLRLFLLALLFFSLCACAGRDENFIQSVTNDTPESVVHDDYVVDMSGFDVPDIPTSLEEKTANQSELVSYPYTIQFFLEGNDELLEELEEQSLVVSLRDDIPTSLYALESRIEGDVERLKLYLNNKGYYASTVNMKTNFDVLPIEISAIIKTHNPFLITKADIVYPLEFQDPLTSSFIHLTEHVPTSLFDIGLKPYSIAETNLILDKTLDIATWFKNRGFPFAAPVDANYSVFEKSAAFEAKIDFNPGEFVRLGNVKAQGSEAITEEFLNRIITWEIGEPWSDVKIQQYEHELLSLGVFSFVDAQALDTSNNEIDEITLLLADGPSRTWGGGVNYDITRQFGLQLFWEHRNLLGEAEKFRASTNLWLDTQELKLDFYQPDITSKNHNLDANILIKHEQTDAYNVNSITLDTNYEIEHYFINDSKFTHTYSIKGEFGREKASIFSHDVDYTYIGTPLTLKYEKDINVFRPTNGYSLQVELAPYYGTYQKDFITFWGEAKAVKYIQIIDNARFILALKASVGHISHASNYEIPASLRFYLGGGNSIRGYAYQSIGPKDRNNDPIGGSSYIEGTGELRIGITDSITLAPFFDMGNLVEDLQFIDVEFKYSTGLGVAVTTPIGPIRFDAAIPLFDVEKDLSDFQIYVSIGQSF